jgi:hypothetical protein
MEEKREIIYSDISSASRKQPYDAMVYLEGDQVIAIDSNGKIIAKGVAGEDDTTVIQAAIGDGPSNGREVSIASGTFRIQHQIVVQRNVKLRCSRGTVFKPVYPDLDMFRMHNGSGVDGCTINVIGTTNFTGTCILVDGEDRIFASYTYGTDPYIRLGVNISNVNLISNVKSGTAICLKSTTADKTGCIYGVRGNKIRISNFEYGIRLYRTGQEAGTNWINGNTFTEIYGFHTPKFLYLESDRQEYASSELCANVFDHIDYQSGEPVGTTPPFSIAGLRNQIKRCTIWDWYRYDFPGFVFAKYSAANHATILTERPSTTYANYGYSSNTCCNEVTGIPIGGYAKVTIDNSGEVYNTLAAAIAAISASSPSPTNRRTIYIHADIDEPSGPIYIPAYTTILGNNATIRFTSQASVGLYAYQSHYSTIKDLRVEYTAPVSRFAGVVWVERCNQFAMENVSIKFPESSGGKAVFVFGSTFSFTGCNFIGPATSAGSPATSLQIDHSTGGILENCTFVHGPGGRGAWIRDTPNLIARGCKFTYSTTPIRHNCTGSTEYTIQLDPTYQSFIEPAIMVHFKGPVGTVVGTVVKLGTTVGGSEIGEVTCAYPNDPRFIYNATAPIIEPGENIYITSSSADAEFEVEFSWGTHIAGKPLELSTYYFTGNKAKFSNCHITANPASSALHLTHLASKHCTMERCYISSPKLYDITSNQSGRIFDARNCTFGSGRFNNIVGLPGQGSATITTGATSTTVTHYLEGTPRNVRVTPTSNLAGKSFWVSDKTATTFKINISEADPTNALTFDWTAEL